MGRSARRRLDTELTAGRLAILMPSSRGTEAEKLDRILNTVYRAALELVETGERTEARSALEGARHRAPSTPGDELWNSVVRQVLEALDLTGRSEGPGVVTTGLTTTRASTETAVAESRTGPVDPISPWGPLRAEPASRRGHRRAVLLSSVLVVVMVIAGAGYGGYRLATRPTCPASATGVGDVVGWDSPRVAETRGDLPDEVDGSSCTYDGNSSGGALDVSLVRLRGSSDDFFRNDPLFGAEIVPGPELDCARQDGLVAGDVSDDMVVTECSDAGLLISVRFSSAGACGAALRYAPTLIDEDRARAMVQALNGLLDDVDAQLCQRGA